MSKNTPKNPAFFLLEPQKGTDPAEGHMVAKNPKKIGRKELLKAGIEELTPNQAIRRYCLDCCLESAGEVRKCVSDKCPLHPFRMGYSAWRKNSNGERENA